MVSMLTAAPAMAAASYVAVFAQPVAPARIVSSDRLWSCADTTCVSGGRTDSPPQHICSRLARTIGVLASFAVREQAFDAAALEACNAKAAKSTAS
jgi:hypothetical protein